MPIEFSEISELSALRKPSTPEKASDIAPKAHTRPPENHELQASHPAPPQGDSRSIGQVETKPLAHTAADDLHTKQLQDTHNAHVSDDELASDYIAQDRPLLASEADTELKTLAKEEASELRSNTVSPSVARDATDASIDDLSESGAEDLEGSLDTDISQAVADADPAKVYALEQEKAQVVDQEIRKDEEAQDQARAAALKKEEQEIQAARQAAIKEQQKIGQQQAAVAKEHKMLGQEQQKISKRKRHTNRHEDTAMKKSTHDELLKRYGHANIVTVPRVPEGQQVANIGQLHLPVDVPTWQENKIAGTYHNRGWHPSQHGHQGGQSISA